MIAYFSSLFRRLVSALLSGERSEKTPAALDGSRYPSQGYAVWLYSAHSDLWR